jgi:hypothetical protein
MEIAELSFIFRKRIRDSIEVSAELPLLSFNSGFLDGFLESYHETFGFPDYGRSDRPRNEFLYEVWEGDKLIIKGHSGRTGIGDISFGLKKVLRQSNPGIALRVDVELPTGSPSKGFGSGAIDLGSSILIDKELSETFKAYGLAGIVIPGDLKADKQVELKEYFFGGISIEAVPWKKFDLIGQVFVQSSPFPKTNIRQVDRTAVLLTFGGRYHTGENSFEVSFAEDPSTAGAPDFTATFTFKRNF